MECGSVRTDSDKLNVLREELARDASVDWNGPEAEVSPPASLGLGPRGKAPVVLPRRSKVLVSMSAGNELRAAQSCRGGSYSAGLGKSGWAFMPGRGMGIAVGAQLWRCCVGWGRRRSRSPGRLAPADRGVSRLMGRASLVLGSAVLGRAPDTASTLARRPASVSMRNSRRRLRPAQPCLEATVVAAGEGIRVSVPPAAAAAAGV